MTNRTEMVTTTGTIVKLLRNRGFGFIHPDSGKEDERIFFHVSGVISPEKFEMLREGLHVSYLVTPPDKKGLSRAIGIVAD